MAIYLLITLSVLILGPWIIGFAVSVWLDASRPKEVEAFPPGEDRVMMVKRLTDEWQEVRRYWVSESDVDRDRHAA